MAARKRTIAPFPFDDGVARFNDPITNSLFKGLKALNNGYNSTIAQVHAFRRIAQVVGARDGVQRLTVHFWVLTENPQVAIPYEELLGATDATTGEPIGRDKVGGQAFNVVAFIPSGDGTIAQQTVVNVRQAVAAWATLGGKMPQAAFDAIIKPFAPKYGDQPYTYAHFVADLDFVGGVDAAELRNRTILTNWVEA